MKPDIHPAYHETTITCACGEVIKTSSTKKNIRVGICSKCHPFFTGKQKFIDTAGRLERFRKKYGTKHQKATLQKEAASSEAPTKEAQETASDATQAEKVKE